MMSSWFCDVFCGRTQKGVIFLPPLAAANAIQKLEYRNLTDNEEYFNFTKKLENTRNSTM